MTGYPSQSAEWQPPTHSAPPGWQAASVAPSASVPTDWSPAPTPPSTEMAARGLMTAGVLAPVALIGGWTVAAALRPGFSSLHGTISDLAARNAPHRLIMTSALVLTGLALIAVAGLLHHARPAGRWALAVGGAGAIFVAANPLPDRTGHHALGAFVTFTALAIWPVLAVRKSPSILRMVYAAAVTAASLALLIAFTTDSNFAGRGGLVERMLAAVEVLWIGCVSVQCARDRR